MGKFLRRNHSTAAPGSIIFVDTETAPSKQPIHGHRDLHTLLMGTATYVRLEAGEPTRRKQIVFSTEGEFWEWFLTVSQPERPTWVFAHNIGFDLTILEFWETLHSGEWRIRDDDFPEIVAKRKAAGREPWRGFYVDCDPPTIISVKHRSGQRAIFLDTMNYWPVSLAKLGQSIGLPKLQMPTGSTSDDEWTKYCRRDVEIIERAVLGLIKWVKDNDYGMFRFTASAQAMAAFRHRFYDGNITLDRPDPVRKLERSSYFGGRLEMLYEGKYEGDVWELDVQSMYPHVMLEEHVPRELIDSWLGGEPFKPPPVGPGRFTLAEVLIETSNATYPLRLQRCTLYAHGRYWTVLCGRELELAFQRGDVVAVGRWATYRLARMFQPFVEHFWGKRQAAIDRNDGLEQQLCKTIMNSLYGKFGQKKPQWESTGEICTEPRWGRWPEFDHETQETTVARYVGRYGERMVEPDDHAMSFTAISAWVTAAARERMRRLSGIAGRGNCLYVVFDAVIVTQKGFQNLWNAGEIAPGKLGKLKIAGYGKDAHFRGFNNYTFGEKRVCSGIKPDAIELAEFTFRQSEIEGIKEITNRKPLPGVLIGERVVSAPKTRRRWEMDGENWTTPMLVAADKPCHLNAIRTNQPYPLES